MKTKILTVGSGKTALANKRRPRIRLSGFWLNEIGFDGGKLAAVKSEYGSLLLRAHDSENYQDVVKEAFKEKAAIHQVRLTKQNRKTFPHLEICGFQLEALGFTIGSVIAVRYEYGFIQILLVDLDKLAI